VNRARQAFCVGILLSGSALGCGDLSPPDDGGCEEGSQIACYDGPEGSDEKGVCRKGMQTCRGGSFGPCEGRVEPTEEVCDEAMLDEDCDGDALAACPCTPGAVEACYSGGVGQDTGACHGGLRVCVAPWTSSPWGACEGEVVPGTEVCDAAGVDEDCDGRVNEDQDYCCEAGTVEACFEGPTELLDVGLCEGGLRTCAANGVFGPCVGQVLPTSEDCTGSMDDEDCDGEVNESGTSCLCAALQSYACDYSGPSEVLGVGACVAGTQICAADGLGPGLSVCSGEVLPQCESCASAADESCDGSASCELDTRSVMGLDILHGDAFLDGALGDAGERFFVGYYSSADAVLGLPPAPHVAPLVLRVDANGTMKATNLGANIDAQGVDVAGTTRAEAVVIDGQDQLLVAGRFDGVMTVPTLAGPTTLVAPVPGWPDVFIAKLDPVTLTAHWVKQMHTAGAGKRPCANDATVRIALGKNDSLWIGGSIGQTTTLENDGLFVGTLPFVGGQDAFLVQLDTNGDWTSHHVSFDVFSASAGCADEQVYDVNVDEQWRPVIGGTFIGDLQRGHDTSRPRRCDAPRHPQR
jgi:hypothetical protein